MTRYKFIALAKQLGMTHIQNDSSCWLSFCIACNEVSALLLSGSDYFFRYINAEDFSPQYVEIFSDTEKLITLATKNDVAKNLDELLDRITHSTSGVISSILYEVTDRRHQTGLPVLRPAVRKLRKYLEAMEPLWLLEDPNFFSDGYCRVPLEKSRHFEYAKEKGIMV